MECSPAYTTKLVTLLIIRLCLLYTHTYSTADDVLIKDSPAYSTVQQTQSVIKYNYYYYLKLLLIDQLLSQCMIQLIMNMRLLFHHLLNMKYQYEQFHDLVRNTTLKT